jgi:hypothetical protein
MAFPSMQLLLVYRDADAFPYATVVLVIVSKQYLLFVASLPIFQGLDGINGRSGFDHYYMHDGNSKSRPILTRVASHLYLAISCEVKLLLRRDPR